LEKTAEENKRLIEENKRLSEELAKWRASAVSQTAQLGNHSSVTPSASRAEPVPQLASQQGKTNSVTQGSSPLVPRRSYTVRAGDTPISIAKQFGVKLEALQAANPKLDARRLRVGQVINLP
jgi:LysM repeat protein